MSWHLREGQVKHFGQRKNGLSVRRLTFRGLAFLLSAVTTALIASQTTASTQGFRPRQVRIIVPFTPGAATDVVARIIANGLSAQWGSPVIVENRPGGSTLPAAEAVARSEPDGQTLLFTVDETFTTIPHVLPNPSFDPRKELVPINLVAKILMVMVVTPTLPVDSLPALIAYARANPKAVSYSSTGPGSAISLAVETLKAAANVDMLHVPYRGIAPALTAVTAGDVQMTISGYGTARGLIEGAKVKPVAIASPQRVSALPDLPTTDELGFRGVDATTWIGLSAPAKTPPDIVNHINEAVSRVLNDPETRKQLVDARSLVIADIGPAAYAEEIRKRSELHGDAVRRFVKPGNP